MESLHNHPSLALDRRAFFGAGAASLSLLGAPALAQALGSGFTHGVASGEPGPDSVLLWTRYVSSGDAPLHYELAEDGAFSKIVAGGMVRAHGEDDFCAKAQVGGLEPGRWYYYRFVAPDGEHSCVGRTRTLPVGAVERFRMAVFSCSNMGFGWFNAYAHAAKADEFDLLAHVGDYFYEYEPGNYPGPRHVVPGRTIRPLHESVALADYRLRHASYRADPDLRRLTQLYPMVMGWDDHEIANDSWRGGAENHQPHSEGDWAVRKAAAMRAYREWLPVSDRPWATYDIGNLATLFRLETRLMGRDKPFDLGEVLRGTSSPEQAMAALAAFRDGAWREPAHTLLGSEQEAWLARELRRSASGGAKWQVLVQQVVMGSLSMPDGVADGMSDAVPDYIRARVRAAAAASEAGLPLNMDAWDGYPAARERLYRAALEADANLVVLAGDSHNAWACDLDLGGQPVGVEFAGHSVTSPGTETNLPWIAPGDLERATVARNPQLKWANLSRRGYMAVELTPGSAACEWRFMDSVRRKATQLAGRHRMAAAHGARRFTA